MGLKKLVGRLRVSEYFKNVSVLMTGTVIAMAIQLAVSPVLSRLYTPAQIGVFGVFTSVYSVLLIMATGRYEFSIMLPEEDGEAFCLTMLSCLLAGIFSAIVFAVVLLLRGLGMQGGYLLYLPASLFTLGIYYSCNYWLNRRKRYKTLAGNRVVQSAFLALFSIAFSFVPALRENGMLSAFLAAQALVCMLLVFSVRKDFLQYRHSLSPRLMWELALRYKRFFTMSMPSGVINTLASQLPTFLLKALCGEAVVGNYYMMNRVLATPITVVGQAIGDVFRQRASVSYSKSRECFKVYKTTYTGLALVAAVPFLLLMLFSRPVFTWFFGQSFEMASVFITLMAPFYFVRLVVSPLTFMTIIAERQDFEIKWQLGVMITTVFSLFMGYLFSSSIYVMLVAYALFGTAMYFIHFRFTYRLAKGTA